MGRTCSIPGREFSDFFDEEELTRSIFEDGKATYANAGSSSFFTPMPKIPDFAFDLLKLVNDAQDRISRAIPMFGATEVRTSPYLPKNTIWITDSMGTVHRVINVANYLAEADGMSLCCGEMK